MNTLQRYLEVIVDPTWDDFHANRDSVRHAFLTCVAIFHAVDRVAEEEAKKPGAKTVRHYRKLYRDLWGKEIWGKENDSDSPSPSPFLFVDTIAHHFKHVLSDNERNEGNRSGLPIGMALGFNETGDEMNLRDLYFIIRDAVRFVHRKAGTEHPALPDPLNKAARR
jgi:hypothetical protein